MLRFTVFLFVATICPMVTAFTIYPVQNRVSPFVGETRLYAQVVDEESLFARLGGKDAITATVDGMYERILEDDLLKDFFSNTDMKSQKGHQRVFLTTAFGGMKADMDIAEYISSSHAESFKKGLNEDHFDAVAGHVVATLESLGVSKELVGEVVEVVMTLRPLFEKKNKD